MPGLTLTRCCPVRAFALSCEAALKHNDYVVKITATWFRNHYNNFGFCLYFSLFTYPTLGCIYFLIYMYDTSNLNELDKMVQ